MIESQFLFFYILVIGFNLKILEAKPVLEKPYSFGQVQYYYVEYVAKDSLGNIKKVSLEGMYIRASYTSKNNGSIKDLTSSDAAWFKWSGGFDFAVRFEEKIFSSNILIRFVDIDQRLLKF